MLFHFLKRQGFHLISQALKNELLPSGDMEPLYFYLTFFIRGSEKIRFGILQDYGSDDDLALKSMNLVGLFRTDSTRREAKGNKKFFS